MYGGFAPPGDVTPPPNNNQGAAGDNESPVELPIDPPHIDGADIVTNAEEA